MPIILKTPTAVRGLSLEPLLGRIDFAPIVREATLADRLYPDGKNRPLGWVIAGGESGDYGRPCHPDMARMVGDQCVEAGIPFFWKQWGAWAWAPDSLNYAEAEAWAYRTFGLRVAKQHHSSGHTAFKVGKHRSGRELDGKTWNEWPEVRPAGMF